MNTTAKSKLALLTDQGEIIMVGKFIKHDNILYSNSSYEPRTWGYNINIDCSKGKYNNWEKININRSKLLYRLPKGAYYMNEKNHKVDISGLLIDYSHHLYFDDTYYSDIDIYQDIIAYDMYVRAITIYYSNGTKLNINDDKIMNTVESYEIQYKGVYDYI